MPQIDENWKMNHRLADAVGIVDFTG